MSPETTSGGRRAGHAPPSAVVLTRDGADRGRLVFPRGASRTTIVGDAALGEGALLAAQFEGPPAAVELAPGGRVTVRPRHGSAAELAWSALAWGRAATTLRLCTAVPWAVAIHGGASRVTADLRALRLAALEIGGGASELLIDLPHPAGVVEILIGGGLSAATLRRPAGVPVRLELGGDAGRLALDSQYYHALAGPAQLAAGAEAAPDRYLVRVAGGTSRLTVGVWAPEG